jgi:hypothetical protein
MSKTAALLAHATINVVAATLYSELERNSPASRTALFWP